MPLGRKQPSTWVFLLPLAALGAGLLGMQTDGDPPTSRPVAPAAQDSAAQTPLALSSSPVANDPHELAAREQMISGLIGGPHDFSQGGRSGRDLCLPCHVPHLVTPPVPRLDLRPTTTQPLRPYQSLDAELTGWSLLCLGCHDGVTARDVYATGHAITVAGQLGNSRLGTRGLRSHPVGTRYPIAAEDYATLAEVVAAGLPLPNGRIQCTTCHDAHNTHRYPGMLKISNERSRMCLTCHRL